MSIASQIHNILSTLPEGVRLIAVTKTLSAETIIEAYEAGLRSFAENRPQELAQKIMQLPSDTEWHFIGHLQTNKVKMVVGKAQLIHSVDSERLLKEIEKEAAKQGITAHCLLQVHIAQEEAKFGFLPDELCKFLHSGILTIVPHIKIAGLMGMASLTENPEQVRREFHSLKQLFNQIKNTYFSSDNNFRELSMGMSGDYPIAIEEGATLVRIGTTIFGHR
ncbi:MAG: YggS family pyridoxal phosphate-dependent enzyme [Prevotellaceae bacterium]|jgi:pyridoxal phosphate enzyme (YggS family)|nr:YggS family pyridoxal phosphate-dependent enzyme [Prevotellaceae bacterium]